MPCFTVRCSAGAATLSDPHHRHSLTLAMNPELECLHAPNRVRGALQRDVPALCLLYVCAWPGLVAWECVVVLFQASALKLSRLFLRCDWRGEDEQGEGREWNRQCGLKELSPGQNKHNSQRVNKVKPAEEPALPLSTQSPVSYGEARIGK